MFRGIRRDRVLVLLIILLVVFIGSSYDTKAVILDAVKGVEKIRLERLTSEYKIKNTANFSIRYSKQDANVLDRVVYQAEKQYNTVTDYFGYCPCDKITLIVYPNKQELKKGLRLSSGDTTLGAYYSDTIGILSPNQWGEAGEQAEEGLYIHELTHLLMDKMASGNYPIWFTEGMALYQEYINTGFEWGQNYVFKNNPYSSEELTNHFNNLDQVIAYRQSFLLVKAIMDTNHKDKILALFIKLKSGEAFERAFEESLNFTLHELENKINMQGLGKPLHVKNLGD